MAQPGAIRLQTHNIDDPKQFALFLRYQTTNDRGFNKCLNDLLKLRAERRKAQIGFESQKLKEAAETRKQSVEKRRTDLHSMDLLLAEAKLDHQKMQTYRLEHDMKVETLQVKPAAAHPNAA